jgi:hypothetical protein
VAFIHNFSQENTEEYVIAYKRYTRDITTFSLPIDMALYEYSTIKGYGLSKSIACIKTRELINSEGP